MAIEANRDFDYIWPCTITRARRKFLGLTMKDSDFQFKKTFFYIISINFKTLGPAYLQYQYSFQEIRVCKVVKICLQHTQILYWTQSTYQKPISLGFGSDESVRVTNQHDQANHASNPAVFPLQTHLYLGDFISIFSITPIRSIEQLWVCYLPSSQSQLFGLHTKFCQLILILSLLK